MADKNGGKVADTAAGAEAPDDPFAELSRVLGFDSKPEESRSVAASADEFAIDLEDELMRELNTGESSYSPVGTASDEFDLAGFDADLESAFATASDRPDHASHRMPASVDLDDDVPVIHLSRPASAQEIQPSAAQVQFVDDVDEAELQDEFNSLLGNFSTSNEAEEDIHAGADAAFAVANDDDGVDEPAFDELEPSFDEMHSINLRPVATEDEVHLVVEPERRLELGQVASAPSQAASTIGNVEDDPFAMLAAMAEKYKVSSEPEIWPAPAPVVRAEPVVAAPPAFATKRAAPAPAPELETVEVSDRATVIADDLDIPALDQVDEPQPHVAFDDIDAEFNSLLSQMSAHEPTPATSRRSYETPSMPRATEFEMPAFQRSAAPAAPISRSNAGYAPARHDDVKLDLTEDDLASAFDDFDDAGSDRNADPFRFDDGFEDEIPVAAYEAAEIGQRPRRGLLIAAIVGGVAVLGVAGALAVSMMGSAQGGAPALVKSDHGPIKVRPANPGGTVTPNQDSSVYETVSNTPGAPQPEQGKLISDSEEPIDLAEELPDNADEDVAEADEPKAEDRLEQVAADAEPAKGTVAVAPRKVRTMVVRQDGSLAPREETAEPQASAEAPVAPKGAVKPAAAAQAEPATDEVANAVQADETPAAVETDQTTASIEAQPAATGAWTTQIASEGSEAAAQAAYKKLLKRYPRLLDGKGVSIVKADIAGKGTRWRVRIPADTRNEATGLCSSFKSAGGSCFVSKS